MKVVLVHGFNVKDRGARSIDKLAPYLQTLGHECDTDSEADYGYWTLLSMYTWKRKGVRERLARAFADADVIVTHSNGANFATQALNMMDDSRPRVLIHFSPALERKTPVPRNVKHEVVFHSKRDGVVRFLAPLAPFLPWGSAGAHGKKVDGPVTNVDETPYIPSHSAWFKDHNASHYARRVHGLAWRLI